MILGSLTWLGMKWYLGRSVEDVVFMAVYWLEKKVFCLPMIYKGTRSKVKDTMFGYCDQTCAPEP